MKAFWDKWIPQKQLVKSEICALEACFKEEGLVYYFTQLKNKNNKLELINTGSVRDLSEMPPAISKNKIPLILVLNGTGIITKKISLNETSKLNLEDLVKQNLPAINPADFFIQVYKQEDFSGFIVLCRKAQLWELVERIKIGKHELADVLLGTPSVIGLQPLWQNHNSIQTSLNRIGLTNALLDTIDPLSLNEETTIKIEGLSFTKEFTLGFAAGLAYLMKRQLCETPSPEITAYKEAHEDKNKLRVLVLFSVAIAFVLAITNVMFYTQFFDKNNKLETELSVYQGKQEEISRLLNDYQKNKDLIEGAGVLNQAKLSEYGDKIGKTLPEEVILSEMYFNPGRENDESEDSLKTFQNKLLVLKGNCTKSFIVNEWINVLKMQKFIKDVSLERFTYNNQGVLPNFEIKLTTE